MSHARTVCNGLDQEKLARAFRFETAEKKGFLVYADTIKEKFEWIEAMGAKNLPFIRKLDGYRGR